MSRITPDDMKLLQKYGNPPWMNEGVGQRALENTPRSDHRAHDPDGFNADWWRSMMDDPIMPSHPAGTGRGLDIGIGELIPPMAYLDYSQRFGEQAARGDIGDAALSLGIAGLEATALGKPVGKAAQKFVKHVQDSPSALGDVMDVFGGGAVASALPGGGQTSTFIGQGAKNFPHESLDIARDIEKAGGGRDEVFQQTGLFRGADKKWRSEIDDRGLKMDAEGLSWGEAGDLNAGNSTVTGLQDVASHPEFDAAYPGVYGGVTDNGTMTTIGLSPTRSGGSYTPEREHIELGISKTKPSDELGFSNKQRSILGHETQHAVQSREGFASGGSPDNFDTKTVYNDKSLSDIESRTMEDIMEKYNIPGDGFFETPVEFMHRELLPDYGKLMTPRERRSLVDIVNEKVDKQLSPYDQYRRLAGEVEARNVQTRLDYTPEQRRMIPPWMTEDVPLGDQIVNFRGGGKSEMLGDAGKAYGKGKITELDPSMQVAPRVSQRVPTPTQMPDVHQRSDVDINLDAMRQKPEAFEKNMLLMQSNPSMPFSGYRNPDVIAEKSMEHLQDNLRHIKDNTPQEFFDRSGNWYKGANALANDITNAHGVPIQASVGVLARLSPKWDWLKNVPNAERLTNIWKNQGDQRWTSEMSRIAPPALTNKLKGTRLRDLDSLDKALWIRTFDKAHNPQTYQGITPEGLMGDTIMTKAGRPSAHVMQSNMNLSKAINMLEDPSIENISKQLGGGHKIRNFYNNIGDPFYGGDITMDTHAIAADTLSPLGSGAREVDQNFGGLGTGISQGAGGTYGLHADAYRNVADELGIMPSELQSPTWETIRETFLNKPRNAPIVERIWDDVRRGVTTSPEARERIMEHFGGYKMPSWFDG